MNNPIIKTHSQNRAYSQEHFFVLNKGLNSGKPLLEPCANCFVILCHSEEQKNTFYWITYSLWKLNRFRIHLRGSVIEFITIKQFKKCLSEFMLTNENTNSPIEPLCNHLSKLEALSNTYHLNLALIEDAKKLIYRKIIRR